MESFLKSIYKLNAEEVHEWDQNPRKSKGPPDPELFSMSGTSILLGLVLHKMPYSASNAEDKLFPLALEWHHGNADHGAPKGCTTHWQEVSWLLAGDLAIPG